MTARIKKLLMWRNPTSVGEGPRWDLEVVREDGRHERKIRAKEADVVKLVREAMR